jgi:hypothetical protein
MTITAAIEAYLKDVEPPQREPKTYEKYRATLHRFRETGKKVYVKDIDGNDCLEFMRCLYANGNEARPVYNLISIVQQYCATVAEIAWDHWPVAGQPTARQVQAFVLDAATNFQLCSFTLCV